MSLLWPDRISAAIFPERVVLARVQGGLRRKLKLREELAVPAAQDASPAWIGAVHALGEKAAAGALAGADVSVILSNHFVKYAIAPGSVALQGREEEEMHSRQCFERIYGAAGGWAVQSGAADPRKTRLVCGVEQALVVALDAALLPLGRHYHTLEPYFVRSFNACRKRLGDFNGWFVVIEPGLMCVALLVQGEWRSARSLKVDAEWPAALPGLLSREELLADSPVECDRVAVYTAGSNAVLAPQAGKWRFERLSVPVASDATVGGDALVAAAAGT